MPLARGGFRSVNGIVTCISLNTKQNAKGYKKRVEVFDDLDALNRMFTIAQLSLSCWLNFLLQCFLALWIEFLLIVRLVKASNISADQKPINITYAVG